MKAAASERGATALIIALCLVLLMGMAAFAVDLSAAKNERRLDQNGADYSVLAGALEYALGGSAQQIIDDAKGYASTNVRPISNADWAACFDPGALPVLSSSIPGLLNGSPCISFQFAPDDSLMRVRVPNQRTNATFGRIIGVNDLTTSAAAEARIFETSNGAYPSGVFSGAAGGSEFCIKTTSPGAQASCGLSTTGDFGNFNPYFYVELGGNSLCTSGDQPHPLSRAIADGLDHRLGTTPATPGVRVNGDDCPGFPGPLNPNRVAQGGGYSNDDITRGLVDGGSWPGSNTYIGRLRRGPYVDGSFEIFTFDIDNKPLWEYIDMSEASTSQCQAAAALNPATPADVIAAEDVMQACLSAETDLLFDQSIGDTKRLATVPKYHQSGPNQSNGFYDIQDFVPVFIQGLWTNQVTCTGVHIGSDPGPPPSSYCMHEPGMDGEINVAPSGQRKIASASALILRCAHLPVPLCASVGSGGSGDSAFYELQLTR